MFHNNRPRYWVDWYDRWHLPLILLLALLLCWLGYLSTLPAPQVSLALADPTALLQSNKPIELTGAAPANSLIRVYEGNTLAGETRADSTGKFRIALANIASGAHAFLAIAEVNGARIESPALNVSVSAPAVAQAPTATPGPPTATRIPPTATPVPPTATNIPPTATPAPPTATRVPPTATPAPPTAAPTLAVGAVQRRGKDNAEMVYVPAGEFTFGDEKSARTIYLDAFWIDKTEVTNAQFQQLVDATGYKTDAEKQGWGFEYTNRWEQVNGITWRALGGAASSAADRQKQPVTLVSWNDAAAFCTWADKRLPTEAQWEKAARGTEARLFPWGNNWDGTRLNFCDVNCTFGWKDASANDRNAESAPVGSYAAGASPYGILDLAGNALEWVADWFDLDYPKTMPARNPTGPASGQLRVLRGGAWSIDQSYARTTSRFAHVPEYRERSV